MRRPRWILALPLSAALHALGLLLLLWFLARPGDLPLLFVDLTALDLDRGGSAASAPEDRPDAQAGRRPATASPPAGGGGKSVAAGPARRSDVAAPSPRSGSRSGSEAEMLASTPPASDSARPAAPLTPDVTRSPSTAVREEPRETVAGPGESSRSAAMPGAAPTVAGDARGGDPASSSRAPGPSRSDVASAPSASRSTGSGGAGRTGPNPGGPAAGPGRGEGGGAPSESGGSGRGAEGSALVGSGGGAGGDGAEYGSYLAQWRRRIHENLRYPLAARRRGLTGTVHLDIVIRPTGAVVSVEVAESSSHGLLDEAAIEAVRDLSPLPFPRHLAPRPLRARLPVVFDLE